MIAHLVLVECAIPDVAFEVPREIPLVVQRHHNPLIVEQVVHAPRLQFNPLAHEPVHHVRAGVGLVAVVGSFRDVSQQLLPDAAGELVRVEHRMAQLLVVWPADGFAISVDHDRHSLLEQHVHELDWCLWRRQIVDDVREVRTIAEDLLTIERVQANKVSKTPPAETVLHPAPGDIGQEALEVGDESEVPQTVEQVGARDIVLVRDGPLEARLALIIVETED